MPAKRSPPPPASTSAPRPVLSGHGLAARPRSSELPNSKAVENESNRVVDAQGAPVEGWVTLSSRQRRLSGRVGEGSQMSGKADFTPEQWQTISEAPVSAGLLVMTAQRGGLFRETLAIARAYADARQQHGQSQ